MKTKVLPTLTDHIKTIIIGIVLVLVNIIMGWNLLTLKVMKFFTLDSASKT